MGAQGVAIENTGAEKEREKEERKIADMWLPLARPHQETII